MNGIRVSGIFRYFWFCCFWLFFVVFGCCCLLLELGRVTTDNLFIYFFFFSFSFPIFFRISAASSQVQLLRDLYVDASFVFSLFPPSPLPFLSLISFFLSPSSL